MDDNDMDEGGPGLAGAFANSLLPYEQWMEEAYQLANRQVMTRALRHVAEQGLPGGHHFYLTFRTDHPGTVVPKRLLAQYPHEMTIVLQHQYWDLKVDDEAQLVTVGLSFGGVPSMLAIPLDAVTGFADPEVQFGMRLAPAATEAQEEASEETVIEPAPAPASPAPAGDSSPQVVSLDAFRRRGGDN